MDPARKAERMRFRMYPCAKTAARGVLLVAGWSATAPAPALAADVAYGAYLAAECASCHRADAANAKIPSLRAFPYQRLVTALREYRAGTRTNPAMQSVARALGDPEIEALAAYFSGQS